MAETANFLKRYNLVEAFAILCALPDREVASLIVLTEPWSIGALRIEARFDKWGKLVSWPDSDICYPYGSDAWEMEMARRAPAALVEDADWRAVRYGQAVHCLQFSRHFECTTDCLAVTCFPLSVIQWRRKFIAERWFHPDLQPAERLVDHHDLAEWNSFIDRTGKSLGMLDRFEEWAQGRESWEGLPKF